MIVKNEEEYLDQCLRALQPLFEQVNGELLIADTGSQDSTKEIAEKYASQVFDYEWCDDFAKARNFVLEKASGRCV